MASRNVLYGASQMAGFHAAAIDGAAQAYNQNALQLEAQREDARKRQIIQSAAKAAVDPATGQYDLNKHVAALEQAGFPEIASEYRKRSLDSMTTVYKALDTALPTMNEKTYATVREQLVKSGMPQQAIPEQYDPEWVRTQHQRLGMAVKKYGEFGQVAKGPDGQGGLPGNVLYGQKNIDTGEVENVHDMSPPRPYAPRIGGGGAGGFAPSNSEKKATFYSQTYGVPIPIALDIVRNEELGEGPYKLYETIAGKMLGQFASEEESMAAARAIVEDLYGPGAVSLTARPGRPLAGDARGQQPGITPQGRGATGSWGEPAPAPNRAPPAPGQRPQQRQPDASGWQPGVVYTLRNGSRWRLGKNGQPEQMQ